MGLTNKAKNTEKRADVSHNCEAVIKRSYFDKKVYFDAKLLNFSKGGVYFETDHDLKPGGTIFLKMIMIFPRNINYIDHERPRLVTLGEVKWRIDSSGRDQLYYGVGVRFPFPA